MKASLVLAAISELWFSGISRVTKYKVTIGVTAFLIAFLIESNNKKLDQIIFHVSDNLIIFLMQSYFFAHVEHSWTSLEGIYIIIDNNYKKLIMFQWADGYLNEPIKVDELVKLANQ